MSEWWLLNVKLSLCWRSCEQLCSLQDSGLAPCQRMNLKILDLMVGMTPTCILYQRIAISEPKDSYGYLIQFIVMKKSLKPQIACHIIFYFYFFEFISFRLHFYYSVINKFHNALFIVYYPSSIIWYFAENGGGENTGMKVLVGALAIAYLISLISLSSFIFWAVRWMDDGLVMLLVNYEPNLFCILRLHGQEKLFCSVFVLSIACNIFHG